MARKKSQRKTSKKIVKRNMTDSPFFIGGIVVALIALFAVVAYTMSMQEPVSQPDVVDREVLVTVNGVPITQEEFNFQYNLIPEQYRAELSREEVLEQIINEELVMQEAVESGVEITDEDVNVRIQSILASGGLSITDLQQNLDFYNVSMEEFESLVRRQLLIQEYTQDNVIVEDPSEEELEEYFEETREDFAVPEQVRVRHILISNQRTDAATAAKDLYDRARAGEDFCELVQNNTDDRGSRDTCGEYTFPRGFMVPEFEQASFDSAPGDIQMIQSAFGYHIIEKLEDLPASTQSLEEVREEVLLSWQNEAYQEAYRALIADLRAQADVEYPGEEPEVVEIAPEVQEEPESSEVENLAPAPADVKSCIVESAILYGATWSTDTRDARDLFEGYQIRYVACDVTPDVCDEAGVYAYPTWVIDGTPFLGRMTLEQLQQAASC